MAIVVPRRPRSNHHLRRGSSSWGRQVGSRYTAGVEKEKVKVPAWVQVVMEERKGTHPKLLMEKLLTRSDLDSNQNRLLVPAHFAEEYLDHALAEAERCDVARNKGVPVKVYTRSRWGGFSLRLTRWGSSKATVLNGHDWRLLPALCGLAPNVAVQLWSFRTTTDDLDSNLNLVIGRI